LPLSYGTPTIAIGASGSATIGPRGQGYTLPGCTLASSSFTTTSLAPSTLLRLARRFPGHYIDQDALRIGTIGPVETSLGTKDSSDNIVYDESNAATPWKPWGAQSGAGEVYTLRYYIPKQLTLLVAIVVSVLVAVFGSWIVMRSVLSKRAKRRH
jgi:hypothetical protein